MAAKIEVKKLSNGELVARRTDGQPLTAADRVEARALADPAVPAFALVVAELRDDSGELKAIQICSPLIQDHIYIALDPDFALPDHCITYSTAEVRAMASKTADRVIKIHIAKSVFSGSRVLQ